MSNLGTIIKNNDSYYYKCIDSTTKKVIKQIKLPNVIIDELSKNLDILDKIITEKNRSHIFYKTTKYGATAYRVLYQVLMNTIEAIEVPDQNKDDRKIIESYKTTILNRLSKYNRLGSFKSNLIFPTADLYLDSSYYVLHIVNIITIKEDKYYKITVNYVTNNDMDDESNILFTWYIKVSKDQVIEITEEQYNQANKSKNDMINDIFSQLEESNSITKEFYNFEKKFKEDIIDNLEKLGDPKDKLDYLDKLLENESYVSISGRINSIDSLQASLDKARNRTIENSNASSTLDDMIKNYKNYAFSAIKVYADYIKADYLDILKKHYLAKAKNQIEAEGLDNVVANISINDIDEDLFKFGFLKKLLLMSYTDLETSFNILCVEFEVKDEYVTEVDGYDKLVKALKDCLVLIFESHNINSSNKNDLKRIIDAIGGIAIVKNHLQTGSHVSVNNYTKKKKKKMMVTKQLAQSSVSYEWKKEYGKPFDLNHGVCSTDQLAKRLLAIAISKDFVESTDGVIFQNIEVEDADHLLFSFYAYSAKKDFSDIDGHRYTYLTRRYNELFDSCLSLHTDKVWFLTKNNDDSDDDDNNDLIITEE